MNEPKPFQKQSALRKGGLSSTDNVDSRKDKDCINMEELMQFKAARQRVLDQKVPETFQIPFNNFVPHRVFINHIDTFNGSHLFKYLSQQLRQPEREDEFENGNFKGPPSSTFSEENEGEDFGGENDEEPEKPTFSSVYEIVGTLEFINNPQYSRPEGILQLLDQENKNEFLEKVLTCGTIIYDITSDLSCHPTLIEEAKWVAESIVTRLENLETNSPKTFSKYTDCRTMILISTLLTWAKTKPIDPEDPSLPFTERDFRKRKPHPNYKVHCELEKRITQLGKKYPHHFRTIVIGSGITYGYEEDILHFYFKMAWQGAPYLPVFRPGTNIIPVIHIDSLASVVHVIMEQFPPKYKYIIAADPSDPILLKELVKSLAKNLGNGKTKLVNKEEALLYPEITQKNYDMLSCNINVVPGYIMDNPAVKWATDVSFINNINKIIAEFKMARGLLPIKIFIHGPPASGKTYLAKRLSLHYDVPHLHVKGIIDETIQTLKEKIQKKEEKLSKKEEKVEIEGDEADEEEEEEEETEDDEDIDTLKNSLREIEDNMDNERQRLDDEYIIRFFKEKLSSNLCKNKGYVIDGYPKTMEQTKSLYEPQPDDEVEEEEEEQDEEGQGELSGMCNWKIMPAFVESLDASDEFLINRVIKLPEIIPSHFEEQEMCRRLTNFRSLNTEDNTPLIFYDELEVHPMIYNVEKDNDPQMEPTFQAILHHVGPPRNYGTEKHEFEDPQNPPKNTKQKEELKFQRDELKKTSKERRENLEHWMFLRNQELEMEEKALLVMGMPLRHYLMKYIFPCLTRGLVEVARVRPDDPVDYLSEFLFRENPEGKMFQPNYDERGEEVAQAIKEYEESLVSSQFSKSSRKSFSTEKSVKTNVVSHTSNLKCSLASSSTKTTSKSKSTRSEKSTKTTSSSGICTCQKSPSLSTCSSDATLSTPGSCTCSIPEPCEPCEPEVKEEIDPCKCPC